MADPRFPPVQGRQPRPMPPPTQKRSIPVVPLVLLLIYAIYVGVMIIAPIYVSSLGDTIDGILEFNVRVAIGGVLLVIFIFILGYTLMDSGKPAKPPVRKPAPPPGATPGPPANRFKPVQPPAAKAPVKAQPPQKEQPKKEEKVQKIDEVKDQTPKQTVVSYPNEVEGGFYGATFIEISKTKVLKLRSLVVEPKYLD